MPGRKIKIITGHYYHIYNRGVAKLPTFTEKAEYVRMCKLMSYYRFGNTPLRYSSFVLLPIAARSLIIKNLKSENKYSVEILTFKLMPNHFHFTLRQMADKGISKFIANVVNSYTKYVNTKNDRVGPLFQGKFKAVLISTPEQLMHLSRYHHLNLYTSGIVRSYEKLLKYPYSSLPDYTGEKIHDFVSTDLILSQFKTKSAYKKFVLDNAEYQKKLARLKKLESKFTPMHLGGA